MSSDVLIDLDSPSPPSTTSDDGDAVNTESARIYFGPLQSAEKKFVSASRAKTPIRRSTRLSSTRIREHSHTDHRIRHPTPTRLNMAERGSSSGDEDILRDEPSVVLASRVLQAHDNPSPPPSPPSDLEPLPNAGNLIDLADRDEQMEDPTAHTTPFSPAPQADDVEPNTSQPDLINFDSFSTPLATLRAGVSTLLPPRPASPLLSHDSKATTVDDLLSLSPTGVSAAPASRLKVVTATATATADTLTPTTDEELQVMEVLTDTLPALDAPAPFTEEVLVHIHTPDALITVPAATVTVPDTSTLLPAPQTPVRRSPRKRSSISPTRPSAVPEALPPLPTTTSDRSVSSLTSQTSSTVFPSLGVRVRKRANSQDVSPNPGAILMKAMDVERLLDDRRPISPGREARRKREAEQPRRLGSLSPTSTDLLMQLLPSGSDPVGLQATATETGLVATMTDMISSAAAGTKPAPFCNESGNAVFTSQTTVESPSPKPASTEPPRTPARRVPIQEAIAQGVYSPPKQPTTSLLGKTAPSAPLFRHPRQALNDPNRSPAKRVPILQAFAPPTVPSPNKGKAPMRLASPTRPASKEQVRSNSAEYMSRPVVSARNRSAEPTTPQVASIFAKPPSAIGSIDTPKGNPGTPLPYPLIPSASRTHPPIPEVDEGETENGTTQRNHAQSSSPPASIPAKHVSSLRQPSANVTSRIPRIGAKPYARPRSKEPTPTPAAPPKPPIAPRRATGAANGSTRPFRALQAQWSGGSSDSSPRVATPGSPGNIVSRAPTQQHSAEAESSHVSTLKRKREGEKSQASPPGAKPFVLIKKVVPSAISQLSRAGSSTMPLISQPISPQKPKGQIRVRKVADWKPPPREAKTTGMTAATSPPPMVDDAVVSPTHALPTQPSHEQATSPSSAPPSVQSLLVNPDARPTSTPPTPPPTNLNSTATAKQPVHSSGPSAEPEPGIRPSSARRSSRSRRTVTTQASDVFGAITPAPVLPLNVRRKRTLPTDTSAFAGMTATALRALTSTNTQRNQQQVVSLKTEVVHKEGKRPGSPTTKVRTILEKQRELKTQQRQQRAERRARRSSEAGESQADESVDFGDESAVTLDEDGMPMRHRRGPGEEEDYETPPRPERPYKRERLEHEVESKGDKRVKWDRGLATAVYLDEITLNPKKPASSDSAKKGCLAPTSKTLRLDTLGNVLAANAPVPNLVREDVVVKKFVYEDDDEDAQLAPEPETETALETKPKGKSKKSKS